MATRNIQLLTVYFTDTRTSGHTIQQIFNNTISDKTLKTDDFNSFTWTVQTKYFTADISVCCCPDHFFDNLTDMELNEVEAVLLISDVNDIRCLTKLKRIVSVVAEKDIEVRLLYSCQEISDTDYRNEVMGLCIDNEFELVENNEEDEEQEEQEDAFEEKRGIDRVVEALKSHVWSNHVMNNGNKKTTTTTTTTTTDAADNDIDDVSDEVYGGKATEEADDASFNELFGRFMEMKATANTLTGDERREYAAKVSLAFMDALGIEEGDSSSGADDENCGDAT